MPKDTKNEILRKLEWAVYYYKTAIVTAKSELYENQYEVYEKLASERMAEAVDLVELL